VFAVLRYLILAILLISLLRPLLGLLARLFLNAAVGPERGGSRPPSPPQASASPEALKKDPVCGTFVAPSTALMKDRAGQTYYFCSPACRDKF
jgi:hypothetical protein